MILFFYEIGVFPEIFAISTIIMASFTDPLIGEVNRKYGYNEGILAGLVGSFLIYYLILGVLFYSLAGSIVAVFVERPNFRWLDDDLLMQIFPIVVLTILYFSGIGPEITLTLEGN